MKTIVSRWLPPASLLALTVASGCWGGPTLGLDRSLLELGYETRLAAPGLASLAAWITALGDAIVTVSVMLVAALSLLLRRKAPLALVLLVTVLAERALVNGLKAWVGRPRPLDGAFEVGSMAFPSGHAAHSMTVYLIVALLAVPQRYRHPAVLAAVLLSLLIGVTRPLLGVHWPTDVVAGWALGLLAVGAGLRLERSAVPWLKAKHEIVGRHGDPVHEEEAP